MRKIITLLKSRNWIALVLIFFPIIGFSQDSDLISTECETNLKYYLQGQEGLNLSFIDNSPPYSYLHDSIPKGKDIDLAKLVLSGMNNHLKTLKILEQCEEGDQECISYEFLPVADWEAEILNSNDMFHLIVSSLAPFKEREENIHFLNVYHKIQIVIASRLFNEYKLSEVDPLVCSQRNLKMGLLRGSSYETIYNYLNDDEAEPIEFANIDGLGTISKWRVPEEYDPMNWKQYARLRLSCFSDEPVLFENLNEILETLSACPRQCSTNTQDEGTATQSVCDNNLSKCQNYIDAAIVPVDIIAEAKTHGNYKIYAHDVPLFEEPLAIGYHPESFTSDDLRACFESLYKKSFDAIRQSDKLTELFTD